MYTNKQTAMGLARSIRLQILVVAYENFASFEGNSAKGHGLYCVM